MSAKYDPRTAKGWPLPYRRNRLGDDVGRIAETFNAISDDVIDLQDDVEQLKIKVAEIARSLAKTKKRSRKQRLKGN